jgi:hypothetical protein
MPIQPFSFKKFRSLQLYSQAYAQVYIMGPAGASVQIVTLLDTGASYSIFHEAHARQAGYQVTGLPTCAISIAGGGVVTLPYLANATLRVEGQAIVVPKVLLSKQNATPVIGTGDFLLRTEFGFDSQRVYFD